MDILRGDWTWGNSVLLKRISLPPPWGAYPPVVKRGELEFSVRLVMFHPPE